VFVKDLTKSMIDAIRNGILQSVREHIHCFILNIAIVLTFVLIPNKIIVANEINVLKVLLLTSRNVLVHLFGSDDLQKVANEIYTRKSSLSADSKKHAFVDFQITRLHYLSILVTSGEKNLQCCCLLLLLLNIFCYFVNSVAATFGIGISSDEKVNIYGNVFKKI
jgi:hypothetical protein